MLGRMRRDMISDAATNPNASAYGGDWTIQGSAADHGTSHLAVVDSEHNAVSFTTTINTGFGAFVMSNSTGARLDWLMG
jgi:gamma-glutamyltranspeptidase/glutathione hydrolase/leukotriene-C4 hydrolase